MKTTINDMPAKQPSSHKMRKGRVLLQNQVYLLSFMTKGREPRFSDFYSARLIINSLKKSRHTKTLAFVVMPDHVHWLIQLLEGASLSRVVQTAKSVSAHQINHYLERRGQFWQDGFHDHALRSEEAVIEAARYIVANPIRAGLVRSVRDYSHWDAVWI